MGIKNEGMECVDVGAAVYGKSMNTAIAYLTKISIRAPGMLREATDKNGWSVILPE